MARYLFKKFEQFTKCIITWSSRILVCDRAARFSGMKGESLCWVEQFLLLDDVMVGSGCHCWPCSNWFEHAGEVETLKTAALLLVMNFR